MANNKNDMKIIKHAFLLNSFPIFNKKYIDSFCAVCYDSNMNNRLRKVKIAKIKTNTK